MIIANKTKCDNCIDKRLLNAVKYIKKGGVDMEDNSIIKEIKCPNCGNSKSFVKRGLNNTMEYGACTVCGKITYNISLAGTKQFGIPLVKCPYCNSTNTKKISEMSKAASVAVFGIFAMGKASKQWHCNNCKSDF